MGRRANLRIWLEAGGKLVRRAVRSQGWVELHHRSRGYETGEQFWMGQLGQYFQSLDHPWPRPAEINVVNQVDFPALDRRQAAPPVLCGQPGSFPQVARQVRGAKVDVQLFRPVVHDVPPGNALGRASRCELVLYPAGPSQNIWNPMSANDQRVDSFEGKRARSVGSALRHPRYGFNAGG